MISADRRRVSPVTCSPTDRVPTLTPVADAAGGGASERGLSGPSGGRSPNRPDSGSNDTAAVSNAAPMAPDDASDSTVPLVTVGPGPISQPSCPAAPRPPRRASTPPRGSTAPPRSGAARPAARSARGVEERRRLVQQQQRRRLRQRAGDHDPLPLPVRHPRQHHVGEFLGVHRGQRVADGAARSAGAERAQPRGDAETGPATPRPARGAARGRTAR